MTHGQKKIFALFLSIFSLFFGIFIYTFFRTPPLVLDKSYSILGLQEYIQSIHKFDDYTNVSEWKIYALPDLLWMFSFTLIMLLVWDFKLNRKSAFWIGGTIALGFAYEFLQLTDLVPGTFDYVDLLFLLAGVLIAFLFTIKIKNYALLL